ncbi:hypothetical protein [Pseudorhodoferax sp.]|jgi:hypothetical protein|uniref:hypothetical protein n=1 Tax=Pseudorhodoferax sp. TaxID=1993553 RepID=UPI002DD6AB03|nr:hypothetical protein [Pseudorhodoferax sp.]
MAWFRRLIQHLLRPLVGSLVLTLLGLQLAVAAYACPLLSSPTEQTAAVAVSVMPDCHGQAVDMDPALTPLCAAHCEADPSTPTTASSLEQPLVQAAALCLRHALPVLAPRLARSLHAPGEVALAHAWAPPLLLSLQVFRN